MDETEHDWEDGLPPTFNWMRKLRTWFRNAFSFFGFTIFWVGGWDIIDTFIFMDSWERDLIFFSVGFVSEFILSEVLSPDSIYWFLSKHRIDAEERINLIREARIKKYKRVLPSVLEPLIFNARKCHVSDDSGTSSTEMEQPDPDSEPDVKEVLGLQHLDDGEEDDEDLLS